MNPTLVAEILHRWRSLLARHCWVTRHQCCRHQHDCRCWCCRCWCCRCYRCCWWCCLRRCCRQEAVRCIAGQAGSTAPAAKTGMLAGIGSGSGLGALHQRLQLLHPGPHCWRHGRQTAPLTGKRQPQATEGMATVRCMHQMCVGQNRGHWPRFFA